jgi:hypothetical protein
MSEMEIENELFDQVFEGIKKEVAAAGDEDELGAATAKLGALLKKAMKNIAVEQLRIK